MVEELIFFFCYISQSKEVEEVWETRRASGTEGDADWLPVSGDRQEAEEHSRYKLYVLENLVAYPPRSPTQKVIKQKARLLCVDR